MNKNLLFKRTVQTTIIIILGIIVLFHKTNSRIKSVGQIIPQSELRLISNLPDNLLIETNHYFSDQPTQRKTYNFDRGDIVDMNFHKGLFGNRQFNQGDIIGTIESTLLNKEIVKVTGELDQAQATLKAALSGEKSSIVEAAENQLKLTETELSQQKIIVKRMAELKKSNLVSDQEFEIAENYLKECEIEVLAAKANLNTVATGEKPEAITVYRKNIKALESELDLLRQKQKQYNIIAPFDGVTTFVSDTLLTFSNQNYLGVIFPVQLSKREAIKAGQKIDITLPELSMKSSGVIVSINRHATNVSGRQIVMVTAKLKAQSFPLGAIVKCNVYCDSEPVYKNILKMFRYIEIN